MTLRAYLAYCRHQHDEEPLYIFDAYACLLGWLGMHGCDACAGGSGRQRAAHCRLPPQLLRYDAPTHAERRPSMAALQRLWRDGAGAAGPVQRAASAAP